MPPVRSPRSTVDPVTRKWIRNKADERAAAIGMRFNEKRGRKVCDWIEKYCCLYEGEHAGKPLKLMPYQRDLIMRLFGWVRLSDEWRDEDGNKCWIRRFTHGALWCSKKNGKSPFLAAIELYMLCGDGEQGQKIYTAAKNGDQAKIAQRHAFMMVKQSPALHADCKLHESVLSIQHLPTNSSMIILTGDDSRGAKSKEGLNGSVFVDECHVTDFEMMERVGRAGISRKEPLNFAVSTAGDDPSSYGYARYKDGQDVNSGLKSDLHYLHVEYSAPDNLTEAQIEERLEEWGKAANPAWGYIVKPSEFRADWNRSKGNTREVARFKQYRINLWIGSTNQWLDTVGWEQGQREFTLEDLRGMDCYLGIDLSRTKDMTAAAFLVPWPEDSAVLKAEKKPDDEADDPVADEVVEAVRVWPMFWLPESTADERAKLFPYAKWANDKAITLTPGRVVNYQLVEEDLVEVIEQYELQVRGIYYDKTYATELIRRLASRIGIDPDYDADLSDTDENKKIHAVPQTLMGLTPLAKELERRVSVGLIQHPGNAVMTWQVGHVEVKTDNNQNIRPVKPTPHSGKSIDGVMAILDAMDGVLSAVPSSDGGGYEQW